MTGSPYAAAVFSAAAVWMLLRAAAGRLPAFQPVAGRMLWRTMPSRETSPPRPRRAFLTGGRLWAGRGAGIPDSVLELALLALSTALKAGKSLPQALEHAAAHVEQPLAGELERTALQARGGDWESALAAWYRRMPAVEVAVLKSAVAVHRRAGGSLGPILDRLGAAVRRRRLVQAQIQARTAEARGSGTVLALAPLALTAYMALFRGDALATLWQEPLGRLALAYSGLSWLAGLWLIRRMTVRPTGPDTSGGLPS